MIKKILFIIARYSGFNLLYRYFSNRRLFIVGYHSIFSDENKEALKVSEYPKVSISMDSFEEQIRFLVNHGHSFLHFSQLDSLKNRKINKPTIIYFDDGFKDNLLNALPILKKYNVTATIFIVPKYADSGNAQYMNWDEIRQISKEGIEIGSHTYNHTVLTEVDLTELKDELVLSKTRIERELDCSVEAFSYPKGRLNESVVGVVKNSGYKYAITTKYGLNSLNSVFKDPYRLKKVAPRVYENFSDFTVRVYGYNIFR